MKLVLVHGQNHRGSSYHAGRLLADQFPGSEIREFFLPQDLPHFCRGCCLCVENEALCPFFTEKEQITREIESADLLIFTTPTYCLRASASMKALLDLTFTWWMVHKPRACMFSKKAVVLSTAAGAGMNSAIRDIAVALFWWVIPRVWKYGAAVRAINWNQVSDKKKARIKDGMIRLAKKIRKGKARTGVKTKLLFNAVRMMKLRNWNSNEAERRYWAERGWLARKRPWN